LPPRTAARFGVIPHSEILNNIADRAIPVTIIVTADSKNNINISIQFLSDLEVSAIEKTSLFCGVRTS